jgi:hypothetical protein
MFLNYWPVVARSWRELFNLVPTLVVVANSNFDYSIISKLEQFGEVEVLEALVDVPEPNQAKLARWFYACQQKASVVSIEDIDTIFLKSDFLISRLKEYEHGKLLGVGSEVYEFHEGLMKFPASNLTGSGELFAKLFGYHEDMSFKEFVEQFKDSRICDDLEDPFKSPKQFSDESLIRALRVSSRFTDIKVIRRDIDIRNEWLDRSWWPSNSTMNISQYTTVNFLRPLRENFDSCRKVIEIFFSSDYPWMLDKRTPIYKNRDHVIRRFPAELKYAIISRRNRLKAHKASLMSKIRD